jgi:hypothetical protein
VLSVEPLSSVQQSVEPTSAAPTSGRIRFLGAIPVDHPTVSLTHHLHDLSTSLEGALDPDGPAVAESLAALIASLSTAVGSYRGFQLTLIEHGYPIVLTAFPGLSPDGPQSDDTRRGRVVTSLRLPLALLDPSFETGSRIVFYAATPGAFVDLAADLTYALTSGALENPAAIGGAGTDDGVGAVATVQRTAVTLDIDLPLTLHTSNISGLAELAAINHAIGIMIDRGHHPDDVHHSLWRQAAAAGVPPHTFAARLLLA